MSEITPILVLDRTLRKQNIFMTFTRELSGLSTCKRLATGCLVCPEDYTSVLSIGYNGPASGIPNDSCTGARNDCGCVHAEANALIKLGFLQERGILMTTRAPCAHCAGLIVNSKKIGVVIFSETKVSSERGLDILRQGNVGHMQCHF